jgi:hypothetical protein
VHARVLLDAVDARQLREQRDLLSRQRGREGLDEGEPAADRERAQRLLQPGYPLGRRGTREFDEDFDPLVPIETCEASLEALGDAVAVEVGVDLGGLDRSLGGASSGRGCRSERDEECRARADCEFPNV